jgi:hypothetical protein
MLTLSTTKKIGKNEYVITGEGTNLFECIMELNKASFGDIDTCGICDGNNLYLEAHIAQGKYKYHSVKCAKCMSSLTFGKRKDDDDVSFLRRENGRYDWKKFEPKE